jgi:hypothetical protein
MRKIHFVVLSLAFISFSCKKTPDGIDGELFSLAEASAGFVYYKNSDAFLDKSAGTGHNFPFLRTRFNGLAATQLDGNKKVIEGAVFPEGSLIVKDLYNSKEKLERYAILFKDSDSEAADANGWVWGYIDAKGTVAEPALNKGASCIGCHSQSGNIDYTLMNLYFP